MIRKTDWLHEPISNQLFAMPLGIRYLAQTLSFGNDLLADTLEARLAVYLWWHMHARYVYHEHSWQLTPEEYKYLTNHYVDGSLDLSSGILVTWLQTERELGFKLSPEYQQSLFKSVQVIGDDDIFILPEFVKRIYDSRSDLSNLLDVYDVNEYFDVLVWWERYGQFEYPRLRWTPNDAILKPLLETVSYANHQLPKFLTLLLKTNLALQTDYGVGDKCDLDALIDWWHSDGVKKYPFFNRVTLVKTSETIFTVDLKENNGVNVVGFAQGVLGLGEDARMLGDCCLKNDVAVAMINAPIAGPEKQIELKPELPIHHYPVYNTTVFCMPPTEMMRLAMEKGRYLINSDAYKIGASPWELPVWPTPYARVRDFVDEFWAQSEFVRSCFMKQGDTPVHKMPIAVNIPTPTENVRVKFSLAQSSYLFYLMFDGNSWLSRKNPLAGVQAFQKAFPLSNAEQKVGLVIKAMNIKPHDLAWQKIEKIVNADPRITVITDKLSRQDAVNLMASCDSYISLHRSEGFGRVIAEAMLLKQPVVVTNFSGNVDFCHSDTSFLVDGELVPLKKDDYLFSEGQYWCDPDIDMAATQIKAVYEEKAIREAVSAKASAYIAENYSIEAVAKLQMQRLNDIWETI